MLYWNVVTRVGTVTRVKMAANQTVENKLFFTPFACQPGREAYDEFEENLLGHGGKSDDHGWSLADCPADGERRPLSDQACQQRVSSVLASPARLRRS